MLLYHERQRRYPEGLPPKLSIENDEAAVPSVSVFLVAWCSRNSIRSGQTNAETGLSTQRVGTVLFDLTQNQRLVFYGRCHCETLRHSVAPNANSTSVSLLCCPGILDHSTGGNAGLIADF
jgi:hypothetical protein